MDKQEFQMLPLAAQVEYINENMRSGKTLTGTCKEIGISKSISEKFKKHGYVLTDNQYLFQGTDQPQIINTKSALNKSVEAVGVEEFKGNTNVLDNAKEAPISQNEVISETKDRGRPRKENKVKTNISIDKELKQNLQIYCLQNDTTLSDLLEKLADDFIKSNK